MSNTHEYPLSEEDFDKFVVRQGLAIVNDVTRAEDGYELYGHSLADNPKFKNYEKDGKDAFSIIIDTPEKVFCNNCDIEFKTGKNPEKCPTCDRKIYDILDNNRRFQQEWEEFTFETNKAMKEKLIEAQPAMLIKYGLLSDDEETVEKHKAMLRAGNQ